MEKASISELASTMRRMYGARQAFDWAGRYAAEATAIGDALMHSRWAQVAAVLGEMLDQQERHRAVLESGHPGRASGPKANVA